MLLKQLTLQNIRSYTDTVVNFSSGTTLLAGDIGSGKSTILLAIEFALFGTSRSDLPGEALLRKGTVKGFVELILLINGQEITIHRALKKEKNGIKQLAGFLLVNGLKKELTPVELKAEVIRLLGYPEEFITKNKNYIFRYTIYTPQESMKQVLQETAEIRLDLLRKIFNVDKYKVIRENVQLFLKKLRVTLAVLNTKLEPLPEQEEKFIALKNDISIVEMKLEELVPEKLFYEEKLQGFRGKLEREKEKEKLCLEKKRELQTISSLILHNKVQQEKLLTQQNDLQSRLNELQKIGDKAVIITKLAEVQIKRDAHITKKTQIETGILQVQQKITEIQQNIFSGGDISEILEKKQNLLQLQQQINEKAAVEEKLVLLSDLFTHTTSLISKNSTILDQAQETHGRLNDLEECPTCLQKVQDEHKSKVQQKEADKINRSEKLLVALQDKLTVILEQKAQELEKQTIIRQAEQEKIRSEVVLSQMEQQVKLKEELKQQLRDKVKENNGLQQELQQLPGMLDLENELIGLQRQQQEILVYETTQKKLYEIELQFKEIVERNLELNDNQQSLQLEASLGEHLKEEIIILEKECEILQKKVTTIAVDVATERANQTYLNYELKQVINEIERLKKLQKELIHTKEKYHWLDRHFLPLTSTIEKHVMAHIHRLFNQLFQEWFSLLIDDDALTARLDDAFTPIIEQNGYEILFGNLSGGERTSASLAYRLSLNKVINEVVQEIQTKDLLILDEPTDGFSAEQLDKVREVLELLALKQIILVSHEAKVESFVQHVIRVRKEQNVSLVSV
ncbi:SMC family ATPase [Candidatus Woesearchaeota archaeon]|jgi:DNA repair protein SbcC/Rad50|nr:SMC family ATPase [Candidatus Woesearchaeota archaeon]